MHRVTVTYADGRVEHLSCRCPGCELWRTVDFQAMRRQYEDSLGRAVLGSQPETEIPWA